MTDYTVTYTDITTTPITVPEDTVNRDSVDVTLFGRIFQNYGEEVNEDLLNLLENFSCPESPLSPGEEDAIPDLEEVSKTQLSNPTEGQFWFNSTRDLIYFYNGVKWSPIPKRGVYAANWGQVLHGQQLPKPVNQQGYIFDYDECIWSVSPSAINGTIDSMNCNTNATAFVTMQYRYANTESFIAGVANYLIVGITGNVNSGVIIPPIQPSPTPTPSVSATPAATATPTPSVTPTITAQPTPTPTPTVTVTRSSTPIPSPTPVPSNTPIPSNTPVPSNTPTPLPVTYCYSVSSFCMGYSCGSDFGWTPLRASSVTSNPAPGYCSSLTSNACNGKIFRCSTNISTTRPTVRLIVNVIASNGQSTGDVEVLAGMLQSSSNDQTHTYYRDFYINGTVHTLQVNMQWDKQDGNSNAVTGTLSANYSFTSGIPQC